MPVPCTVCGQPCAGKAQTCSPACQAERRRQISAAFRDRRRGGPRSCVVCGQPITAPTATNTCSPDCKRARRLGVPLDQLPPLERLADSAVCDVCGKRFRPWRPRQKGCSPECMRQGRLRRKLDRCRKGPYPPRPCCVCGQTFTPERKSRRVCADPACRAQHKRNLAAARSQGQLQPGGACTIFCVVCGAEVQAHANTLTCANRECVLERRRQVNRQRLGILPCSCIVCGERFWPPPGKAGSHYTCSEDCRIVASRRRSRRGYEIHREERLAEQAQRLQNDPAYRARRQEIDRLYRQRRAERELTQVAQELQRRIKRHDEETQA